MCFSHLAAVFDPPLPFDGSLSPDVFSLLDSVSDPPLPFDGSLSPDVISLLDSVSDPPLPLDGSLIPDVFSLLDSVSDPPLPLDGSVKVMLCSLCLATVIDPSFPLDGSVFPSSCRNWSSVEWGRTGEIYKTEPSWICWQQICLTANSSSTVPCQRYKSVKIIWVWSISHNLLLFHLPLWSYLFEIGEQRCHRFFCKSLRVFEQLFFIPFTFCSHIWFCRISGSNFYKFNIW